MAAFETRNNRVVAASGWMYSGQAD